MKTYTIEVAFDACGDDDSLREYVEWLNEQGHDAKAGNTTGTYIDGLATYNDERAREISEQLWEEFCNSN